MGLEMLSIKESARKLGLDEEEVLELMGDFVQYARDDLRSLRQAMGDTDHEAFAKKAHSIKGAALNLQLTEISSAAREMELMGKNEDLAGAEEVIDRLSGAVERLAIDLKDYSGD